MSIGKTLLEAREQAGVTVEEVAAATRIRRTLVMGIERDDFSGCGGDFYARGHIRTIAAKVGVDPAPLLVEFDAARAGSGPPRATDVFESETAARPERRGPNWSAAMAAALVLVLVYGAAQALSGDDGTVTDGLGRGAAAPTTSAPQTAAPTAASPGGSGTSSAVAQAPRDQVTVAVRAEATSWVQVTTASGEELFQGLLADESRTFSDRSRIRLVIGNAGAVSLTVNGTPIGAPGKAGQVARVQFTPADPTGG